MLRIAPARRARAFTLVELLVVIGIIGLLISILLPSLGRAREAAREIKCRSNMRQVYTSVVMYIQANRNTWPRGARLTEASGLATADELEKSGIAILMAGPGTVAGSSGVYDYTRGALVPYVSTTPESRQAVFACPSDDASDPTRVGGAVTANALLRNFSYAFNSGIQLTVGTPARIVHCKVNQVIKPAEKIAIYEEFAPNDGFTSNMWSGDAATGDMPSGRHGVKRQNNVTGVNGGIRDLSGRGNYIFFDGHLESLEVQELVGTANQGKHTPVWAY